MSGGPHPPVGPKIPRRGQPWAREKLEFLRYYLGGTGYKGGGFMVATRRAGASYYIDLFAGSGQSVLEDGEILDGSPVIAAKAQPAFTLLFWVDADRSNAASLRAHRQDYPDRQIQILDGDANVVVDTILSRLPKSYPVLAFLDPEGSELDWATIAKLARHKTRYKVELFILFAWNSGIVRFFPRDRSKMVHQDKLDRVMPSPSGWRAIYERRDEVSVSRFRRLVLGEYVSGLKDLGYRYLPDPRLVRKPDGKPLYFMIFATDNEAGLKIMKYALSRVEATPVQRTFLPYEQQY